MWMRLWGYFIPNRFPVVAVTGRTIISSISYDVTNAITGSFPVKANCLFLIKMPASVEYCFVNQRPLSVTHTHTHTNPYAHTQTLSNSLSLSLSLSLYIYIYIYIYIYVCVCVCVCVCNNFETYVLKNVLYNIALQVPLIK